MGRRSKDKRGLTTDDVNVILGEQPMDVDLMVRVCEALTKFTKTQTICLEGLLPKKMARFTRKRHSLVLLQQNRWICCFNDGRKTLTQYNTNDFTDTTELSTRLLRTYNVQPFEMRQAIVKSDCPLPSSDIDSGFVSVAIAAVVGKKKPAPSSVDPVAVRKNLLKMMYRGKLNGFPDYQEKGCKKGKVMPDEVLFSSLFAAFDRLNQPEVAPPAAPTPVPTPAAPRKVEVQTVEIQEVVDMKKDEAEQNEEEPQIELFDDISAAVGLKDCPLNGRRIIKYEKGPNSAAVSVATTGASADDKNVRFIQYERVTKEIHYIKPKSGADKSE